MAVLFQVTATHCVSQHPARGERFLAAALALLTVLDGAAGDPVVTQLLVERHAALISPAASRRRTRSMPASETRITDAVELAVAHRVQIVSLTRVGGPEDAVALAVDLLSRLGFSPPSDDDMPAAIGRGLKCSTAGSPPDRSPVS